MSRRRSSRLKSQEAKKKQTQRPIQEVCEEFRHVFDNDADDGEDLISIPDAVSSDDSSRSFAGHPDQEDSLVAPAWAQSEVSPRRVNGGQQVFRIINLSSSSCNTNLESLHIFTKEQLPVEKYRNHLETHQDMAYGLQNVPITPCFTVTKYGGGYKWKKADKPLSRVPKDHRLESASSMLK